MGWHPGLPLYADRPGRCPDRKYEQSFFSPEPATITVGDTITWTNNSGVTHTTTNGVRGSGTAGNIWDQTVSSGSSSTTVAFNSTGTFNYFCSFHSGMDGTIIVEAAEPTPTPTATPRPTPVPPTATATPTPTPVPPTATPTPTPTPIPGISTAGVLTLASLFALLLTDRLRRRQLQPPPGGLR
ncbi:MAG: hypothetical protein EXR53_01585 [Dehalococcoidia bacterium]|nr:hypothetical protein [Dehalococcoidia bacterium]